jgi:hypothetical protein
MPRRSERAILIDPWKRTFTPIEVGEDFREVRHLLNCKSFKIAAWLKGSIDRGFDVIYASDDPLEDNPQFYFQIDTGHNPPSSFPIAGFGLIQGVDTKDATCDTLVRIEEAAARITFLRGFEVREIQDGIKVAPKASIIDEGE